MLRRLTLLCLLLGLAADATADDPPAYQIIRPADKAHELLPKTCRVCHKDEVFRFLVIAAPTDDALERVVAVLSGRTAAATGQAAGPANPHTSVACLFCHLQEPAPGAKPETLTFRTMDGSPATLAQVANLCQLCHPEGPKDHAKVLRGRGDPEEFARAGLPVPGKQILCSSCHEMHAEQVGPSSLRLAYLELAARSTSTYVHGNRAACRACHRQDAPEGSQAGFSEDDATARCTRCHPADHRGTHPMQVKASSETYPMDFLGYPLDGDGQLNCSTCHDHPCRERVDDGNPRFLRGGPYLVSSEFCYRCHPKAGQGALNPHRQVDDKGKIITTTCAFCHRRIPDPEDPEEAYFGPEDLVYVHSPVELCLACHDSVPHPGVNHLVEMAEDRVRKLHAYEERHGVSLPLDRGSQIVCTTCHNPHDKGVLRGKAALGARELNQWRVPSFAELCTPCHARYD